MTILIIALTLTTMSDTTLPVYELEEVVVTATRIKSSVRDLPTNVTVITKEMIIGSNAHTVAEAIESALGVTEVSERGTRGSARDVRIRSGGDAAKQVLVMLDGQPINDVSLGAADLDEILTDYVERIEIIRGPNSVLYGANALGGVINIITRKPSEVSSFQASGGSFLTQKYNLSIGIKQDRREALFTANRDVSDGWRENSDYGGNDFFGKLENDFERWGKLGFRFMYHNSEFGVPGQDTLSIKEYDGESERKAQSPDARQKRQKEYAQIEYENNIGEKTLLKLKAYSNLTNKRYEYPGWFTDDHTRTFTYGTEAQINTIYGILFGVDMHRDECVRENLTTFPATITIDENTVNQSVFLQKISPIGKAITVLGVRYDYHSVFGGETNPCLSFVYHLLDNLKLSANVGRAFRAPTFEDLYSPHSSWPTGDSKGNPNLKPEKAWGYDMGFEYRIRALISGQITLFKSDVDNLIQWAEVDPDTAYEKWRPSNVGKSYNQGVEVKITHWIFRGLHHSLQCNYLESKGKKEGEKDYKTLMYTPPFRSGYRISYDNTAGFGINISANFTEQIEWEDDYGTMHKLPGYTLVNTRVSQKIFGIEMFFAAKNVFNNEGKENYLVREGYPLPGRAFTFGSSLKL